MMVGLALIFESSNAPKSPLSYATQHSITSLGITNYQRCCISLTVLTELQGDDVEMESQELFGADDNVKK